MDLIDLFIGSEGTLGIVTEARLRILPLRPAACLALVPFGDAADALEFVRRVRDASMATRRSGDASGIDVAAIEHMDARSIALIRADGADRAAGITLPPGAATLLLVTLELPAGMEAGAAFEQIGRALDADAPDTPIVRFCRMLAAGGLLEHVEIALPGDKARAAQLTALREAVPVAVNGRIGRLKAAGAPVSKIAADIVVPFDRLGTLIDRCAAEFERRGLDAAVWGHISDGNLHPNVIPRGAHDVEPGTEAVLACGRHALRLGGAPLAEHGVGRNRIKQRLLREMYGDEGIEAMRRVKRALDPDWKLAPGVLFETP
jgi:D-lactate dehydrogenase (cytochrome)